MQGEGMEFDRFASTYDEELNRGLRRSGESKDYFASGRTDFLASQLRAVGLLKTHASDGPCSIWDFGCGTGSAVPHLLHAFPGSTICGTDVSSESLEVARAEHPEARFCDAAAVAAGEFDGAYCNGVFHHIPPSHRSGALGQVRRGLRPGGWFALFENNPWNPVTVKAMRECAFDDDAITLTPTETQTLLVQAGFEVLRTRFLFFFPRAFRVFRFLELRLSMVPVGAQYVVLAKKA